jgi:hypothetical protein
MRTHVAGARATARMLQQQCGEHGQRFAFVPAPLCSRNPFISVCHLLQSQPLICDRRPSLRAA